MKNLFLVLAAFFAGLWWSERSKKPTPVIYFVNQTAAIPSTSKPDERKSRTPEEMSPTYKKYRDDYLVARIEYMPESPKKHERRFEKILQEFNLLNLTEMEARDIKGALQDLFGMAAFEIRQLINNYNIRFGRHLHSITKIITCMRRLIVRHILPCNA